MAKNITESQARAIAKKFLDNIGSDRGDFADMGAMNDMLIEGAKVFIENAQKNLEAAHAISSGELASSLTFKVSRDGTKYVLSVGYKKNSKGAKYYDFVNKGVAGTKSNTKGATGEYKFKTPYAGRKLANLIQLWLKKNGSKVKTRDAQKYTLEGVESKGVSLASKMKQVPSLQSLSYAIATNIKQTGLRATHFFDDAIEQSFNETFRQAVAIALGAEVQLVIRNTNLNAKK